MDKVWLILSLFYPLYNLYHNIGQHSKPPKQVQANSLTEMMNKTIENQCTNTKAEKQTLETNELALKWKQNCQHHHANQNKIEEVPKDDDMDEGLMKQLGKIQHFVNNQIYLTYGDYREIQLFYKQYFVHSINFLHRMTLLAAKAHYLCQNYMECIKTLQNDLPLVKPLNFTFKILYERQIFMIKSLYLIDPSSIQKFRQTYELFNQLKVYCTDWQEVKSGMKFHQNTFNLFCSKIKKRPINQSKKWDLTTKTTKIFQGIPVYIVQVEWLKQAIKYTSDPTKNRHPGPCLNLRLQNHIYQFQSHELQHKQYTDTIMFPVKQKIDYVVMNKKNWLQIQQVFDGVPIKRVPVCDGKLDNSKEGDCLAKMVLEVYSHVFVMQWQVGLLWSQSVLSYIIQFLAKKSYGQLKELKNKVNHKGEQYIEEEVVSNGIVCQTKNRYKFVFISPYLPGKIPSNFLFTLITTYNLTQYPQQLLTPLSKHPQTFKSQLSQCRLILSYSQKQDKVKNFPNPRQAYQKNNKPYRSNSALHSLSQTKFNSNPKSNSNSNSNLNLNLSSNVNVNKQQINNIIVQFWRDVDKIINVLFLVGTLGDLMRVYAGSIFVGEIGWSWGYDVIQYGIAFADFIKGLWFSAPEQKILNCNKIINKILETKQKKESHNPNPLTSCQQKAKKNPIYETILTTLMPLFNFSSPPQDPFIYSSIDNIKNHAITKFKKENTNEIFNLLSQYHFIQYSCRYCDTVIGYRFQPNLCLMVDLQESYFVLKLFFINRSDGNVDHQEQPESAKDFIRPGQFVENESINIEKGVMQVVLRLQKDKNFQHACLLLQKRFKIIGRSTKGTKMLCILLQKSTSNFIELPIAHLQPIKIDQLNQVLSTTSNQLYVFKTNQIYENEHELALVFLKNPLTNKLKAYPQVVQLPILKVSDQEGLLDERNINIIKSSLSNNYIQIKKIQIIDLGDRNRDDNYIKYRDNVFSALKNLKLLNSNIKKGLLKYCINIYTDSKIGSAERIPGQILIEDEDLKSSQNAGKKRQQILQFEQRTSKTNFRESLSKDGSSFIARDQKQQISLQQCIYTTYSSRKIPNTNKNQSELSKQKVFCDRCNKEVRCFQASKLLQFKKYMLIGLNRYSSKSKNRLTNSLSIPLQMSVRELATQGKKKSTQYKLKSMVLSHLPTISTRAFELEPHRYYTIVRGIQGEDVWSLHQHNAKQLRQIQFKQIDRSRIEVLLYQRLE